MSLLDDRFWEQVEKTETCWLWTGKRDAYGYGIVLPPPRSGPRLYKAHRFAYMIQHGPIPPGLYVLHHCDVPHCVRGDHLYAGTQTDNNHDMWSRGRGNFVHVRGERVNTAKLTVVQVREIRTRAAAGERQNRLAAEFGITPTALSFIVRRVNWKHID